ncbi:MAG TPA: TolC family protein [Polyangiaceae bacterium]|nr:TolC family protein [Polyangiaceae bacterium]
MPCAANSLVRFVVPLALVLVPRAARAEVVKLEDLETLALKQRGSLAAARARVGEAEARIDAAKVPYHPTLDAKADVSESPGGTLVNVPVDPSNPTGSKYVVSGSRTIGQPGAFEPIFRYEGGLTFLSRLYDFGRTAASVRAARADRDASVAGERSERLSVALEVRAAYLGWLVADGTRAILAQSARDSATLRASVEAHIAEGARPGAELASARFDEARAKLDLERSENDLVSARFDVEQATGAALPASAEPDRSLFERQPAPLSPATHPDVNTLERRRDAALAAADAHGYPHAPVVAVAANAGVHGQQSFPFPLYQVMLSVTVPVLDGGLEAASAAQAAAQAKELDAQAHELGGRVAVQNRRARASFESAERRVAIAEELVAAADDSVKHAVDQHELGDGTLDAVVQARIQASRARLEVLTARVERARAVLDLEANATR